jgi:peptidoglycan/xylan/chitin deacetylase (PgdA/CDA1 family)
MHFYRPNLTSRILYPDALFRVRTKEKRLILTFDDGPDPETTLKLAGILGDHNVKAIFFCTGRKAAGFPDIINSIKSGGHVIGNHGFDHLNGFRTSAGLYIENVRRAGEFTSTVLFRPPYGKMRPSQYLELIKDFRIVLWDLMPYDFDKGMSSGQCLRILKKKIRPGSVIVLHDSVTSTVLSFMDSFLVWALETGYSFSTEI